MRYLAKFRRPLGVLALLQSVGKLLQERPRDSLHAEEQQQRATRYSFRGMGKIIEIIRNTVKRLFKEKSERV